MQKSKVATIAIIIFIVLYVFLSSTVLIEKANFVYWYYINPIFWIGFVIFLKASISKSIYKKVNQEKKVVRYALIAVLTYILTYMISGLFVTFGKSPYASGISGVVTNLWIFAVPLICREYIRYVLIQNVYEKDRIKIAVLVSAVYILIDLDLTPSILMTKETLYYVKLVARVFIPSVAKNILFSYIAIYYGYMPSVYYNLLTNLYIWIAPILPNMPWIMTSVVNLTIPILLLIYIRFEKTKNEHFKSKEKMRDMDPRYLIPWVILIIVLVWFALGFFPIKPVSIGSGSMEKTLMVGDIVIIKECKPQDVIVGDIIQFKDGNTTTIHRVIEKYQEDGEYYFVTKGDNNKKRDKDEVLEENLKGKVIFKVRYLGYPAVWISLLDNN